MKPEIRQQLIKGLWNHQIEAFDRCERESSFGLFFQMGAGKSATAITVLRSWFMQAGRIRPTLVLCPQIVIKQWQEEFFRWSKMGNSTVPLIGTGPKRLSLLEDSVARSKKELFTPIYITNYETLLVKGMLEALHRAGIEVGVFDESHKLKNSAAKRTKAAIGLADQMHKKLILTGTPILNSPMDVFGQFRVLDGGRSFGENFFVFRSRWFEDKNAGMKGRSQKYFPDWKPRKGLAGEFGRILNERGMRVTKEECMDLPPLIKQKVYVEMTPKQKRVYKELEKDFVAYVDGGAVVAQLALTKILRLQQIITGFVTKEDLEGNKTLHEFEKNPRVAALEELVLELSGQHKIIIWAAFRRNYKQIEQMLDKNKIKHVQIYGGQSTKERQDALESFRGDDSVRCVVASQRAGGTGVNLVEASYAVYFSRDYSLESDMQSEARNHRGGSNIHEKVTRIDIVTPDTVDEKILAALERKENIANSILEFGKGVGK